ncbi:hypothetical protein [Nocardia arthritidis]|uniref:Uncharacterized protein n=1 Tax=Nocardia arthritidis TaxID=228602 RepID=A0A6G9YJJ3_9NOCA|nr:hypothetical protein [Nocardia arthritidis]QIS13330.1 hypothetical protein F5544_27380 [Nocardia arthritidis]
MTDAIHFSGAALPEGRQSGWANTDRVPPLQGLLVAESDREITVRVAEGTWTFRRSDVLRMRDGAAGSGAASEGRPVMIDIRAGATADFTRRLRIDLIDRPLTIADEPSEALGDELLQQLTQSWADRLRLPDKPGAGGATFTYCQTRSAAGSDDGINCDSLD